MKLVLDENLGRLATWLRVLGLDTVYLRPGTGPKQKEALARGRILLSRTGRKSSGRTLVIESDDPFDQLRETLAALSLDPDRLKPFSRCLRCNTPLRPISREKAAGTVPDYVLATQSGFKYCPACRKVFWPGTHQARMARRIERLKLEMS